jgi:nicotinamidase-related amidase
MILVGIEAHVCVLQTALRALAEGWTVFLAEDALGSRRMSDRETALKRMVQAGCVPATVEMLIMEALGVAQGEKFKGVLPLLKEI